MRSSHERQRLFWLQSRGRLSSSRQRLETTTQHQRYISGRSQPADPPISGRLRHSLPRETGGLGGKNGRLWNYCYANPDNVTEHRVRECAKKLVNQGDAVFLYTCQTPPDGLTVKAYESLLLSKYLAEHCELPPLNFASK